MSVLATLGTSVRAGLLGADAPASVEAPAPPAPRTLVPYMIEVSRASVQGQSETYHVNANLATAGPGRASATTLPAPRLRLGPFATRGEAEATALACCPPVWDRDAAACSRCGHGFGLLRRRHHCRNCGATVCASCCVTWPRASLPEAYLGEDGSKQSSTVRVCSACDGATAKLRLALLAGDVAAARAAYDEGRANVNLRRPFPQADGALLPVHCAAAGGSLAALRWLAEEQYCSLAGAHALSFGRPRKAVLRIAIEHAAVDVMQWLLCAEGVPAHVGVPVPMPHDTGVATAPLHRALHAALREGWQQRALTEIALEQAITVGGGGGGGDGDASTGTAGPGAPGGAPATEELSEQNECVVCFSAPRDCVLVPCGHAHTCMQCGGALIECPMCRTSVERALRLYTDSGA